MGYARKQAICVRCLKSEKQMLSQRYQSTIYHILIQLQNQTQSSIFQPYTEVSFCSHKEQTITPLPLYSQSQECGLLT